MTGLAAAGHVVVHGGGWLPSVDSWPWVTLALLGAFHGANPAMGWLFATALGLQERRAWGVVRALPPIAVGHAASVVAVLIAAGALALVVPPTTLRLVAAAVLFTFAGYRIVTRFRHPTWVGMRVGPRDLTVWSFLMASAHGAGLMLLPVLLRIIPAASDQHAAHVAHADLLGPAPSLTTALAAIAIHTAALFAVMAAIALGAYQVFGVGLLRRVWVNLDIIWVVALVGAGVVTLLAGVGPGRM